MLSPKNIGNAATPAREGVQAEASSQEPAPPNHLDRLPWNVASGIASQLDRDDLESWRQSTAIGADSVANMNKAFTALKAKLLTAPAPKPASRALAAMLFHGPPAAEESWPTPDGALGCNVDEVWGALDAEAKDTQTPGQNETALVVLGEIEARLALFCEGRVYSQKLLDVLGHVALNDWLPRANAAILALHRIREAQKWPLNFNVEFDPTAEQVGVAMEAQTDLLARRDRVLLRDLSLLTGVASQAGASPERNAARANLSKVLAGISQRNLRGLAGVAFNCLIGSRNIPQISAQLTSAQWIELFMAAIPHFDPPPSAALARFFSRGEVLRTVSAEPGWRQSRTFIAEMGSALAEDHVVWAVQATLASFAEVQPRTDLFNIRRVGAGMALEEWAFASGRSEAISRVFAEFYEAYPETGFVAGLLLAPALKGPVALKLWNAVWAMHSMSPEATQRHPLLLALVELAAEHNDEVGVHLEPDWRQLLELEADEVLDEVVTLSAEGSPRIYGQRLALLEQFVGPGSAVAAIQIDVDQRLEDDPDVGIVHGEAALRWIAAQRGLIDDPILDDLMASELVLAREALDAVDDDIEDDGDNHPNDDAFGDLRTLIETAAAHHPALLHETWSLAVAFAHRAMHPNFAGLYLSDAFEALKAIVPQLDASAQAKLFDESNDVAKLCFVSANHSLSVDRLEDAVTRALPLLGYPLDSVRALAMTALMRMARTLPPGQLLEIVGAAAKGAL